MTRADRLALDAQRRRVKRDTHVLRVIFWAFAAFAAGAFCGMNIAALSL